MKKFIINYIKTLKHIIKYTLVDMVLIVLIINITLSSICTYTVSSDYLSVK